jgi:hypothetical protein
MPRRDPAKGIIDMPVPKMEINQGRQTNNMEGRILRVIKLENPLSRLKNCNELIEKLQKKITKAQEYTNKHMFGSCTNERKTAKEMSICYLMDLGW